MFLQAPDHDDTDDDDHDDDDDNNNNDMNVTLLHRPTFLTID